VSVACGSTQVASHIHQVLPFFCDAGDGECFHEFKSNDLDRGYLRGGALKKAKQNKKAFLLFTEATLFSYRAPG
jgi:hypothetical protein